MGTVMLSQCNNVLRHTHTEAWRPWHLSCFLYRDHTLKGITIFRILIQGIGQ